MSAVKPEAAFYIFPKMDMKKFHIKDDEKFALDFLKEKKILVTHGGGFHWNTPDHFRIVYLPDVDTLTEACTRMKDFLHITYRIKTRRKYVSEVKSRSREGECGRKQAYV